MKDSSSQPFTRTHSHRTWQVTDLLFNVIEDIRLQWHVHINSPNNVGQLALLHVQNTLHENGITWMSQINRVERLPDRIQAWTTTLSTLMCSIEAQERDLKRTGDITPQLLSVSLHDGLQLGQSHEIHVGELVLVGHIPRKVKGRQ